MRIFITGSSGFIGSFLKEYFSRDNNVFTVNLRGLNKLEKMQKEKMFNSLKNGDCIINCAASLRPSNLADKYINSEFPIFLMNLIKKKKLNIKFIHLSTINTLQPRLKDAYTISKEKSDRMLIGKEVFLLRLPLIIQTNNTNDIVNKGQVSIFYKYLNMRFPIYPMIFPGNQFNPLEIKDLSDFIKSLLFDDVKNGVFNLLGKNKLSTWDLFYKIALSKNKKVLKLNLNFILRFIPINLEKIIFKYNFLYNILGNIDFEDIKEKKKII